MAKKKNRKKQQFKYGQATVTERPSSSAKFTAKVAEAPTKQPNSKIEPKTSLDDFSYIKSDLIRVGTLGGLFVIGQLALWYAFNHTGLGPAAYSLIKL